MPYSDRVEYIEIRRARTVHASTPRVTQHVRNILTGEKNSKTQFG